MIGRSPGSRNSLDPRIYSCLRTGSSIFRTHLLRDDQSHSACSPLLASLRTRHPFHCRTFSLVRVKSNLASPQTTNPHRFTSIPCVPRVQPALGSVHSHQPGMDSVYFLSPFLWLYRTRAAKQIRAERSDPRGKRSRNPSNKAISCDEKRYYLRSPAFDRGRLPHRVLRQHRTYAFPIHLGHPLRGS